MRTLSIVLALSLAVASAAQTTATGVTGLFADDWRSRNAAAAALATAGSIDAVALRGVIDGSVDEAAQPEVMAAGRYGGRGLFDSARNKLILPPRKHVVRPWFRCKRPSSNMLPERANFTVDWGSRSLAVWVAERRGLDDAATLAALRSAARADDPLGPLAGRALVALDRTAETVTAALGSHRTSRAVGAGLVLAGDRGLERLGHALTESSTTAQTTALEYLPDAWLKSHPPAFAAAAEIYFTASSERSKLAGSRLAALGSHALPLVRAALGADSKRVRRRAVGLARVLGKDAAPLVSELIPLLRDDDARVRLWAVQAVAVPDLPTDVARKVAGRLDTHLTDNESLAEVIAALEALGRLGDGVRKGQLDGLRGFALHGDAIEQHTAIESLQRLGKVDHLSWYDVQPLLRAPAAVRLLAVRRLGAFGARALPVLHRLMTAKLLFRSVQPIQYAQACRHLAPDAVPGLIGWLDADAMIVRQAAVFGLAVLVHDEPTARDLIEPILADADDPNRGMATVWLGRLAPRSARVAERLVALIGDADAAVRSAAAEACGTGAANPPAVAALVVAAGDAEYFVRGAAYRSLRKLNVAETTLRDLILAQLDGLPPDRQDQLARLLPRDTAAGRATDQIVRMIAARTADAEVIEQLGRIAAPSETVRTALQGLLTHAEEDLRWAARRALFALHTRAD